MSSASPTLEDNADWEELLSDQLIKGVTPPLVSSMMEHVKDQDVTLLDHVKLQIATIGGISNYHWWVSLNEKGEKISCNTYPRKSQFLLSSSEEGAKPTHIPSSPRNQILFFKLFMGYGRRCFSTLQHILQCDRDGQGYSVINGVEHNSPPPKKRRYAARQVEATSADFLELLDLDEVDINMKDPTLYREFCEDLTSEGEVQLRRLCDDSVIVAMSDYSSTTGKILPLKYVHVTAVTSVHPPLVKCSCKMYSMIQGAALKKVRLEDEEEAFLSENLTCLHCLFYKEYIHDCRFDALSQNTSSHIITRIQEKLSTLNNPVVVVGPARTGVTSKFSVIAGENSSIVHIYFTPKHCYAKCQEGLCQAKLTRTKIPKSQSKSLGNQDTLALLCVHMHTLAANLEVLHATFPDYFNCEVAVPGEADSDEDLPAPLQNEDENTEDITCAKSSAPVSFNIQTGFWEHKAHSIHQPTKDPHDSGLVEQTLHRNSFIRPGNLIQAGIYKGCYKGPDLIPPELDYCPCGACSYSAPEIAYHTKVYTRMGVLMSDVYQKKCTSGKCIHHYNGVHNFVFFLSKETGIGEEIFWDFISRVHRSKCSFTGFSNEMTGTYTTTHLQAAAFLSNKSFINVLLSWIAALKIDFRQEVDPWCKHHPKVLACDGTKVGVSYKMQKLDPPITEPNVEEIADTLHKKYDRCFLTYPTKAPGETGAIYSERCKRVKRARQYLLLLVRSALEGLPLADNDQAAMQERRNFIDVCNESCQESIFNFLVMFINREEDPPLIQAAARVLSLFATNDDALSSVLPFRFHQDILTTCQTVLQGEDSDQNLEQMKQFAVEISNLLLAAQSARQDTLNLVVAFVRALVQQVISVHAGDRPVPPPEPHEGSYNPPSGTAYYFTPHGNQVRDMPSYSIQGKDRSKDTPGCNKDYPQVPYGGFGFMFLFFCPYHGHCYGFHLIDGGEGRKDPFAALFKYMEDPPEDVFYDFACKLQEYCLNREPAFFRSVRFWHDLFHAINHICGVNFKSTRIMGLQGLNSEICEQFNSNLQCVKYTGAHLSQPNFMLFCQFCIYLWNQKKTKAFKDIAHIAMAGHR